MIASLSTLVIAAVVMGEPTDGACKDGSETAETSVPREELVKQAIKAFEKKEYETAVAKFEAAYEAEGQAVDLFNIGRVYEESGNQTQARRHYEMFLEQEELTDEEKAQAKERLAALPPPDEDEKSEDTEDKSDASVPAPRVDEKSRKKFGRRDGTDRKGKTHWATIAGASLLPAGIGGLVAGGVLAVSSKQNRKNAEASADADTPVEDTPHYQTARNQARAANAMFAVGGIVTAAGVVFLATGLDRQRKTNKSKQLSVLPGGTSIQLKYRF